MSDKVMDGSLLLVSVKVGINAYADKAAVDGEGNAAIGIIPGVCLVGLEDGELDAVDGLELVKGHAQSHSGEDI